MCNFLLYWIKVDIIECYVSSWTSPKLVDLLDSREAAATKANHEEGVSYCPWMIVARPPL